MSQEIANIQITLTQILDLALGTPEVGSVNFNILHNFLHILLHKINLQDTKVEYRNDNALRIKTVLESTNENPRNYLQEYSITPDLKSQRESEKSSISSSETSDDDGHRPLSKEIAEMPSDESENETLPEKPSKLPSEAPQAIPALLPTFEIAPMTSDEAQYLANEVEQFLRDMTDRLTAVEIDLVNVNEDIGALRKLHPETSPTSKPESRFPSKVSEKVQESVDQNLKDPISTPTRLSSDEKTQSDSEQKEDTDNEEETQSQRISSIIQRSSIIAGVNLKELNSDVNDLKNEMSLAKQEIVEIHQQLDQLMYDRGSEDDIASEKMRLSEAGEYDPITSQEHEKPQAPPPSPQSGRSTPPESPASKRETTVLSPGNKRQSQHVPSSPVEDPEVAVVDENQVLLPPDGDNTAAEIISHPRPSSTPSELHTVNPFLTKKRHSLPNSSLKSGKVPEVPNTDNNRSSLNSKSSEQIMEAMNAFSTLLSSTEEALSARIHQLEVKVIENDGNESDTVEEKVVDNIQDTVVKVKDIQGDISRINQGLKKLNDDGDQYKANADVLMEQIELLKTLKADKADLQEALADKADANIINRKVSNDRFETTCQDFVNGLEETISRMTQQELMLQEALNLIHQEIGTKVDRAELTPLKDSMHNRLQALQDKVRELAEKKRENEAAGTKKILTGLQCISCDTNAVMKVEQGPYVTAVPCGRNPKPYLAYQLDPMKKQRKTSSKNATLWPTGPYDKKSKPLSEMIETYSRGHLCNRYCGGSHTITNPQQRVSRAYHFPTDSSPEAAEQLSGGQIRGTDGNLYHGHPLPPGVVLTPKPKVCGIGGNVPCNETSRPPPAARERQGFNADLSMQRKSTLKSQRTSAVEPLSENSDGKQAPEAEASTAENF